MFKNMINLLENVENQFKILKLRHWETMARFSTADLTPEERQMLVAVRKRKADLLEEIEVR